MSAQDKDLAAALNRLSDVLEKLDTTIELQRRDQGRFAEVATSVNSMADAFRDVQKNAKKFEQERAETMARMRGSMAGMPPMPKRPGG